MKTTSKPQEIKKIFSSIALNYDNVNRVITFGMDTRWRRTLVKWSKISKVEKILDCATGTGVLAFEFQKQLGPDVEIMAVDFCPEMLEQAKKIISNSKDPTHGKNIHFQLADIHQLPFPDQTFDICSIGYGLRNVENLSKTIKEMARVTKDGGAIMILETGDKPMFLLYPFFYLYFRYIVPHIGGRITGQKSAYEYLQKSSRSFPSRRTFLKLIEETKYFSKCECKPLFFGASFIYKAHVSHPK